MSIKLFKNFNLKGMWQGFGMKAAAASPELMLIGGTISLLVATVHACTKTEKAKKIAADTKEKVDKVEETLALKAPDDVEVSPEVLKQIKIERGKQYTSIYLRTAYEYAKLYGVDALLWFFGIDMIFHGHFTLKRQVASLAADVFTSNQLFREYRERVAKAVGEEAEEKIYMGAQEGTITVIEKDEATGEEKLVQKQGDVFYAQPGSIFALNFTEETSDAFDIRSYADHYLDSRWDRINSDLELGLVRAYSALDILRKLGFNENAWGDNDEYIQKLLSWGISGNARKVPDPEMRKLKITRLRGYQKRFDPVREIDVYVPCLRLDFNFYPLEGKV